MQTTGNENARAQSDGAPNTAERRARHRLDVFVGTWRMQGQQYEGVFGGAARVTAQESFEWLPGGKFLIHRLVGRLGDAEMACIEVIEAERTPAGYRMHTFYNDGRSQDWLLADHADRWIISADWSLPDGSKRLVRCTLQFENGGTTRKGKWESSTDRTWNTFWEVTSAKTGP